MFIISVGVTYTMCKDEAYLKVLYTEKFKQKTSLFFKLQSKIMSCTLKWWIHVLLYIHFFILVRKLGTLIVRQNYSLDKISIMNTHTQTHSLIYRACSLSLIHQACFLAGGRKPENMKETCTNRKNIQNHTTSNLSSRVKPGSYDGKEKNSGHNIF